MRGTGGGGDERYENMNFKLIQIDFFICTEFLCIQYIFMPLELIDVIVSTCSCRGRQICRVIWCRRTLAWDTACWCGRYHVFYIVSWKRNAFHYQIQLLYQLIYSLPWRHLHHVHCDWLHIKVIIAPEETQSSRLQHIHLVWPVEFDLWAINNWISLINSMHNISHLTLLMVSSISFGLVTTNMYDFPCSNFWVPFGVKSKFLRFLPRSLNTPALKNPCTQCSAIRGLASSTMNL